MMALHSEPSTTRNTNVLSPTSCLVPTRNMSTPPPTTPNTQYNQGHSENKASPSNPSPSDVASSAVYHAGASLSSLPSHLSPSTSYMPASPPNRGLRYSPSNSSPHAGPSPGSPIRQPGSNGAVDVEMVLKAAGGDLSLAIDMLIVERNSFHSQNSQLWKMLEKQKRNAAHLVADNERLRGERDRTVNISGVGLGIASAGSENRSNAPPLRRHLSDQATSPIAEEPEDDCEKRKLKPTIQSLSMSEGSASSPRSPARGTPTSFGSGKTPTAGTPQLLPSPPLDPSPSSRQPRRETKQSFPPEIQRYMSLAETASLGAQESSTPPPPARANPLLADIGRPLSPSLSSPASHSPSGYGDGRYASGSDELQRPRTPVINALTATPPQRGTDLPPLVPLSPFFADSPNSSAESKARRASPSSASDSPGSSLRAPASEYSDAPKQQPAGFGHSESSQDGASPQQPSLRSQRSPEGSSDGQRFDTRPTPGNVPPPNGVSLTSPRQPRLIPALLQYARVTIPSSSIFPNHLGKDVLCFIVSVTVRPPNQAQSVTWTVGKLFSAFVELDATVKSRIAGGRREARNLGIQQLPEGRAWKDFAPSKIDQRKATLETYLQSLMKAPLADKSNLCEFLSTDAVSAGVSSNSPLSGRKEGYLTKKGKNFGGWKTRYFVLQGPTMEYYESRGGTHLGSIPVISAQIGRQHKDKPVEFSDENSYRHAFLIIEARRPGFTTATRHVLCADSDEERDSWVEMLVRYVTGEYCPPSPQPCEGTLPEASSQDRPAMPRSSTSSSMTIESARRAPAVRNNIGDMIITRGAAQPLSSLPADASNAKLFQPMPSPSIINAIEAGGHRREASTTSSNVSPDARGGSPHPSQTSGMSSETPLSSLAGEMYTGRPLSDMNDPPVMLGAPTEATSRKAKRQSVLPPPRPERMADRAIRQSFGPSYLSRMTSGTSANEAQDASRLLTQKISAPSGGQPIPTGYKFGAKDVPTESGERDRKAKSGRFWGFGKSDRSAGVATQASRPVFGTPLSDSNAVASVADLPAIVFRCIQYLEAKHAEQEEGIYRLSGSSAVIKGLRDRFNLEGDIDLLANDEFWDPHAIAGLLKSFLRELPTSLLTRELHLQFIATMDFINPRERVSELSRLVSDLPSANYTLLRALTSHLILVVKNSAANKMTLRNIGIVFSPTLGIPAGIFSELVSHFTAVFDDEPEYLTSGEQGENDDPTEAATRRRERESSGVGRRNRNSMLYQAAGAEAMLGLGGRELDDQVDESDSDSGETEAPQESDGESSYDPDTTIRPADLVESLDNVRAGSV